MPKTSWKDEKPPAHTRFSNEVWLALRKAAADDDRSIASYIERAVIEKLRNPEKRYLGDE